MVDLLQRIGELISVIDERVERERKTKELGTLADKFVSVNEKLNDLAWACRFAIGISENDDLFSLFEEMKNKYKTFRKHLVGLWGEQPDKIDILEPTEFYEPLEDLLKHCRNLELQVQKVLRTTLESVESVYNLANTLSIIPDIEIDSHVFENAANFLREVGSDARDIAEFVKKDEKVCSQKIKEWKSIKLILKKEQEKLNLRTVHGKKLSDKTREFLSRFVEDNCEIDFEFVDSDIVNELKEKLPGLCKKLRVRIG
jgi:hypothetical protein